MMRLVEKGLMYGNLFEVSSASLVERYNRALKHLTGKQTKLKEFSVDISGFSPEIGDELGDDIYLNPNGCNRQFILLSPSQKIGPLLNAKFSTSRSILRKFIDENEEQIFALTARDAIAGELVNSVYDVSNPTRLFNIRKVRVEADTSENHVADGAELRDHVDRFLHEDDAWWDDVLVANMIELAKKTGDITRYPVSFTGNNFVQGNFYTEHFGGLYIFRDVREPAVIAMGDTAPLQDLPLETLAASDHNAIASFLDDNKLTEPIVKAKNANAAAIIQQKLDFILIDVAAGEGEDTLGGDRRKLRALTREYYNKLPEEFHALADLLHWINGNGNWPKIDSEHPAYFYSLRASQGENRDLVNMLLSQLTPRDIRQLFICHKSAFYRAYASWGDAKRSYVAEFLEREYVIDKAGARRDLFGPEPGIFDDEDEPVEEDLIAKVGPWGAVRR